jgi:hypothetical protein
MRLSRLFRLECCRGAALARFRWMRTLHPQWAGYTYTWWRDRDLVHPVRRVRGEEYDQDLRDSPFLYLLNAAGTRDLPSKHRSRKPAAFSRNARYSGRNLPACELVVSRRSRRAVLRPSAIGRVGFGKLPRPLSFAHTLPKRCCARTG